MSQTHDLSENYDGVGLYEIRLKGHLDERWTNRFEGLTIKSEADGVTVLTGPAIDQATLHGLLKRIRDLGMPLISVCPVESGSSPKLGTDQADTANIKS